MADVTERSTIVAAAEIVAEPPETDAAPKTDSELRRKLYDLLSTAGRPSRELDAGLEKLRYEHQDEVYAELIFMLSHLRFPPTEARHHWQEISQHRRSIEERLGSAIDPRVALVNYFLNVDRKLTNPKVIEMSLFERTQDFAYRDELTGLYNYRFFDEHLSREISRGRRSGAPLSLLMIDVDDFKPYNDGYGHDEGNEALRAVARMVRRSLRKEDVAARYGGEEFAVVLPATPKTGATVVAERARFLVERCPFGKGNLTISIGVATYPADAADASELIRQADRALYAAKAAGKNRVHLFGESSRSHVRQDLSLAGKYRVLSTECHDLTTVKISSGGMLLEADRDLPIGTLVEIDLVLPESGRAVRIPARVICVNEKKPGTYEATVRTTDIAMPDRGLLAQYLSH